MTFSSGSFGQLRSIIEATPGVTPTTGNYNNIRNTGATLKASVATTTSQEITAHRMTSGLTRVDQSIDGGFNFELSAKEYDPFLEGLLGQTFQNFGTGGLGAAFNTTSITATAITASAATTGSSIFTNLAPGTWFKVIAPAVGAGISQDMVDYFADRWFQVAATGTTSTALAISALTPIQAPGLGGALTGFRVSQGTIQNASSLTRSFSLEWGLTDINQSLLFSGMQTNSFSINFAVGSIVTGSFDFLGRKHPGMRTGTGMPGTAIASQSYEVMNSVADIGSITENGVSILSGASSFIKSAKIDIKNNLRGQKALGVFGNAGVGTGEFQVEGTIEMYVEDATYYNRWINGVTTDLSLGVADAAGNGYNFEFEKVQYKDGAFNPGGRSDDAMLSLPFIASYNAATGRGIRITRSIAV